MRENEKIQGEGILRLFEELLQEGIPLKLHLSDNDRKHLTGVTGLGNRNKLPCFLIDCPANFPQADAEIHSLHLDFEFTGKDKLKYFFNTVGGEFFRDKLRIPLPQVIVRKQRRKLFRIDAPSGTKLYFTLNATRYELKVIDISLGGSLGILVDVKNNDLRDPILPKATVLKDIELLFPPENKNVKVTVERAEVKRRGKNPLTNQYTYGIEFLKLNPADEKNLTDLIYRIQREFLRKRLRMDA
jgi:c-di-GMP-binding flagellar brake protein YcgR